MGDEVVYLLGQGFDRLRVVERLLGEVSELVAHHGHEGPGHYVAQAPVGEHGLLRVVGVRYLGAGDRVGGDDVAYCVHGARLHDGVALVAPCAVEPLHDFGHRVALGRGSGPAGPHRHELGPVDLAGNLLGRYAEVLEHEAAHVDVVERGACDPVPEQLGEAVEHLEVGVSEVERLRHERVGGAVLRELLSERREGRDRPRRVVGASLRSLGLLLVSRLLGAVRALEPGLVGVLRRGVALAEDLGGAGDGGVEGGAVGVALAFDGCSLGPVEGLLELLEVPRGVDVGPVEGLLELVDDVGVLRRVHPRAFVVGLEGRQDGLRVVHEVDHEDLVLSGARPVDAGVGLDDLDGVPEGLVYVERHELLLVEARLELVGDDEQPALGPVERPLHRALAAGVHVGLRVLVVALDEGERIVLEVLVLGEHALVAQDLLGEGHERLSGHLESQLRLDLRRVEVGARAQVGLDRVLVADDLGAARGDDHGLRLAAQQRRHVVDEVVDDPLGLLHDVSRVQGAPFRDLPPCLALVHEPAVGVLRDVLDPRERLQGDVSRERVDDVSLFDRLPHRVEVEAAHDLVALVVLLAGRRAEEGLGLRLGRRGEGEERHVRRHQVARLHLREVRVHDVLVVGGVVEVEHRLELELVRRGVERGLEGGCRAALLRAVGLVYDDREACARELRQGRDVRPGVEERLDRDDDDLPLLAQRLDELGALRGVRDGAALLVAADHDDLAGDLGELGDRLLDVLVEGEPVGHHHDAREHLLAVVAAQAGEVVRAPGYGLGLSRAGGMLDEVASSRPVLAGVGQDLPLGVELVVAREDLRGALAPAPRRVLPVLDLLEDEPVEDGEPVVPLQDRVPEVVGPVLALGGVGVARAAVPAEVEREEAGLGLLAREGAEVRAHPHLVLRHREMDGRPPLVHEQRVLPAAVGLHRLALLGVLVDRVLHRLGQLGLDLAGRHRDAVDEQGEVDRLPASGLVVDLVHEAQDVGVVALPRAGDPLVVGIARHALDGLVSRHLEPFSEREDRSVLLQALDQGAPQMLFPAGALLPPHLLELLGSGLLQVGDEVVEEERIVGVEPGIVRGDDPARALEARDLAGYVALEGGFLVDLAGVALRFGHGYPSVQSILPVTAWWMIDFRYSSSLSMSCSWRAIASLMAAHRSSR